MAKKSTPPTQPKPTPTQAAPVFTPAPPSAPPKKEPEVVEILVIGIESDDEILSKVPTLAKTCKWLKFTSSEKCASMERWQTLFEAYGFKCVRNTYDPTIRTQLYQSLLT